MPSAAQRAPVAITKNGRTHTVLLSAAMFEVLVKGRVARTAEELDDEQPLAVILHEAKDQSPS
ncbi:MAG: hypothetical protein EOS56_03230 [Mesorhizobium sp.]|nr:MAG: hypothetical protein EOS55_03980 [Mesorhizobium sp.]RWC60665.1 MAG: hypothetical protein EOS29_19840 [Mesorhizobium sp.]RWC63912.1 MAG: hypothetical protein EOS56_03230 [Mesorhizobium sp.]